VKQNGVICLKITFEKFYFQWNKHIHTAKTQFLSSPEHERIYLETPKKSPWCVFVRRESSIKKVAENLEGFWAPLASLNPIGTRLHEKLAQDQAV